MTSDRTLDLLTREVQDSREAVYAYSRAVLHRVEATANLVRKGRTVNSLGELQQLGPQFDAACARHYQAQTCLDIYLSGMDTKE
jgi:hypothetical protein